MKDQFAIEHSLHKGDEPFSRDYASSLDEAVMKFSTYLASDSYDNGYLVLRDRLNEKVIGTFHL